MNGSLVKIPLLAYCLIPRHQPAALKKPKTANKAGLNLAPIASFFKLVLQKLFYKIAIKQPAVLCQPCSEQLLSLKGIGCALFSAFFGSRIQIYPLKMPKHICSIYYLISQGEFRCVSGRNIIQSIC